MITEHSYKKFKKDNPSLFRNSPGGIEIINAPGTVYGDRFITLVSDPVRFPNGDLGTYNRLYPTDLSQGVAVLPVLSNGRIVLVDHFRHATREWHWEIPRGFGTLGVSGRDTAGMELSEEIGAKVLGLHYLGEVHPDTGLLAQAVLLYMARIDEIGTLDQHEGIREAKAMTVSDVERHIRAGNLRDGFTLAAMYRARLANLI